MDPMGLQATSNTARGASVGARALRGGLSAVNYAGRGYEAVSTGFDVITGIQQIRAGNPLGWISVAGAGLSGGVASGGIRAGRRGGRAAGRSTRVTRQSDNRIRKVLRSSSGCNCFVAGTDVSTPGGPKPIESIVVGQRVVTFVDGDEIAEPPTFEMQITPSTWRKVTLVLCEGEQTELRITLLRAESWLELHTVQVGGVLDLNLPELGARGLGRVLTIDACPAIEDGDGLRTRVVTATFHHAFGHPWQLKLDSVDNPISVTRHHQIWSLDRDEWVSAGHLRKGERVKLAEGECRVESFTQRTDPQPVYNLEVDADHVYRVTSDGLLVHNASACSRDLLIQRTAEVVSPRVSEIRKLVGDEFAQVGIRGSLARGFSKKGDLFDASVRPYDIDFLIRTTTVMPGSFPRHFATGQVRLLFIDIRKQLIQFPEFLNLTGTSARLWHPTTLDGYLEKLNPINASSEELRRGRLSPKGHWEYTESQIFFRGY